eukprot:Seg406.6 transcript_id=Seg406.6/GoldUCD/mRNA.D3Y31 product="Inhibitor of growth protein 3" protein_id=Seg406.6/GoldUCD/D3Y31
MSGLRNVMRFRQSDDDPQKNAATEVLLKAGDFFLNKRNNLIEIRQLRGTKKNFLTESAPVATAYFLGMRYRRRDDGVHFALPNFIDKSYVNLKKNFKKKVTVQMIREDGDARNTYCCILDEGDEDGAGMEETDKADQMDADSKYCFCREPENKDDMIRCEVQTCRIKWYHMCCVGISADKDVPQGDYVCPRCSN